LGRPKVFLRSVEEYYKEEMKMTITTKQTQSGLSITLTHESGIIEIVSFAKGEIRELKAFLKLRGLTK